MRIEHFDATGQLIDGWLSNMLYPADMVPAGLRWRPIGDARILEVLADGRMVIAPGMNEAPLLISSSGMVLAELAPAADADPTGKPYLTGAVLGSTVYLVRGEPDQSTLFAYDLTGGRPLRETRLPYFARIWAGADNTLLALDEGTRVIHVLSPDFAELDSWSLPSVGAGRLSETYVLDADANGLLYALDLTTQTVKRFAVDGTFVDGWPVADTDGEASLLAVAPNGTLFLGRGVGSDGPYIEAWGPARLDGWRMEIFDNPNLWGTPRLVEQVTAPVQDWGALSPGGGLLADGYSVRIQRDLALDPGRHSFVTNARGGVRLIVNGNVVMDEWDAAQTGGVTRVDWAGGLLPVVYEYRKVGRFGGFALAVPTENPGAVPSATPPTPATPLPTSPPTLPTATPSRTPSQQTPTVTPTGEPSLRTPTATWDRPGARLYLPLTFKRR